MIALEVKDLAVTFSTLAGEVKAVRGVNFKVDQGEALAIVGESGCGKTQTVLALMGLLGSNGRVAGFASIDGKNNLLELNKSEMNDVRGKDLAMVFQDPMSSLHPSKRIGKQLTEGIIAHLNKSKVDARNHAINILKKVGVPEPERRMEAYAHQLSGGLRQRIMIAMALMCNPKVIIADEPTTALDVTIQAQILELFNDLRKEFDSALILITHDLAVVAKMCDRMAVMYAGKIVESGKVADVINNPQHPYTLGLLHSTPRQATTPGSQLFAISGQPPDLLALPTGCSFKSRCHYEIDKCSEDPQLLSFDSNREKACHVNLLEVEKV